MQLPEHHQFQTRFEMEHLPTVWDGYDVLPVRAKYFSRTGKFIAAALWSSRGWARRAERP